MPSSKRKKRGDNNKKRTGLNSGGLNTAQAAEYIGVSEQWLRMSRMERPSWAGPRYVKVSGRTVIYRPRHLDEFLAARTFDPADRIAAAS